VFDFFFFIFFLASSTKPAALHRPHRTIENLPINMCEQLLTLYGNGK